MRGRNAEQTSWGPVPRGLPDLQFLDGATIRLISTAYIDEPALKPLADDDHDLDVLASVERLTSVRHDEEMPLPSGVRRSELLNEAHGYGWTHVNAAFCYTRPGGNRFNGPERGAWYAAWGSDAAQTAQAEVCFHLTRELANVGVYENVTDYRELVAGFAGRFADLRQSWSRDYLDPNPVIGHPAGQKLAGEIRSAGIAGLVYPSVRRSGGLCLAAFRTNLVQNIRQGCRWRFTWSGSPTPTIVTA